MHGNPFAKIYMSDYGLPEFITSPVDVDHLIIHTLSKCKNYTKTPLKIKRFEEIMERFSKLRISLSLKLNKDILEPFICLLRIKLNPRDVYEKFNFTYESFDELYHQIEEHFYSAILHYGNSVGIIAGQSIGERSTQSTLDAFHRTGSKQTGGIARMKEIVSVQKMKTPRVDVFIKDIKLPHSLLFDRTVHDLKSLDAYTSKKKSTDKTYIKQEINRSMLMQFEQRFTHLTLKDIVVSEEHYYVCDRYPVESTNLNITKSFVGFNGPLDLKDKLVIIFGIGKHRPNFFDGFIFRHMEESFDMQFQYIACPGMTHNLLVAYGEYEGFKQSVINDMLTVTISGIVDIEGIEIEDSPRLMCDIVQKDGEIVPKGTPEYASLAEHTLMDKKLVLNTKGSNLLGVLLTPGVDGFYTMSNNIAEVEALFGIRAARQALVEELAKIINPGGKVNVHPRHIELLADTMTTLGFIQKADRVGAKKGSSGPIALAGFEETMGVLSRAAKYSEEDPMEGVSANIMFSQVVKKRYRSVQPTYGRCGTGQAWTCCRSKGTLRATLCG
jgi:DNA-directed RNA polymerase beta' subunit